jgi:beta-fructofuranosidase
MAFVGRLTDDRFEAAQVQQLGMGPDFYAPAATRLPDGRWLLFGWIPEDPPSEDSCRTWAGSLTLPRIVSLDRAGRLSLALADEVLRCRQTRRPHRPVELIPATPWERSLPSGPVEVEIAIEPIDAEEVVVELRDVEHGEPMARAGYRPADRVLSLARAGIVGVAGRSSMTAMTLPEDGRIVRMRLIIDGSILEMETNGHVMATARLPERPRTEALYVAIASIGGRTRLRKVDIWPLDVPAG